MDTRRDADRIGSLKALRAELKAGNTRLSPGQARVEIRALDREIATLERLHGK